MDVQESGLLYHPNLRSLGACLSIGGSFLSSRIRWLKCADLPDRSAKTPFQRDLCWVPQACRSRSYSHRKHRKIIYVEALYRKADAFCCLVHIFRPVGTRRTAAGPASSSTAPGTSSPTARRTAAPTAQRCRRTRTIRTATFFSLPRRGHLVTEATSAPSNRTQETSA